QQTVTYVGSYQPIYYLLVGLPSRWLPPSTGWYAMRVVSALLVAALLASAARSVAELARRPWVVVGAAAAVTPTVLFLSGAMNPNSVEIAASLAVWASLLALLAGSGAPPGRNVARVGVATVALACTRPTSPVLLLAIVVFALLFGATRERLVELWASPRVRVLLGVVGAAVLANLAFVAANDALANVIHFRTDPRSTAEWTRTGVDYTPRWLDEALGSLAWLGFGAVRLPPWVRWLWWATIAAVIVVGLVRGSNRQRAVLGLLTAAGLIGPIVATVMTPEVQWQGRYGLPVLIGIPLLAGLAADRRAGVGAVDRWVTSGLVAAVALGQVAAHQQLMVRNLLGLPAGLLRGVLNATWNGPLPPLALLGMALIGSAGFAALALALIWRPPTALEPAPEGSATPDAVASGEDPPVLDGVAPAT
ncbi:MAG: DUF2142 domain-containing protein, partial [Actinobacteria bacterium]|nr:DUF2142 domain-containing protein [Actinomycetota bacterium]